MTDVSISEMTYTMLSLLFLLLGIVLIVSIIMSKANPYDSIAFANVEKLRATMNQVCFSGGEASIKFNLPQNTPKFTALFTIMPIWITQTNGDPNYVLYYESYPVGDALGWEVYHNMQNRLVASLPDNFKDKTKADVDDYVNSLRDSWNTRVVNNDAIDLPSKGLEGIIINNIMLGETRSDYYLGAAGDADTRVVGVGPENALEGAFKYGDWKGKDNDGAPRQGPNQFIFNNYATLNSFEKTAIKYQPCGENSLCFKTRSGVYRYPLDQCSDIKAVQMVYDARDRDKIYAGAGLAVGITIGCLYTGGACAAVSGGVGSGIARFGRALWNVITAFRLRTVTIGVGGAGVSVGAYEAASWFYGAFLSYKVQDFNLASSCNIKEMTITRANCNNAVQLDSAPDQKACTIVVSNTMYEYGTDGKLHEIGNHYTCAEKVNSGIDQRPSGTYGPNDMCLQILVTEKSEGFCWTPDPYRPSFRLADFDKQLLELWFLLNQRININNILENTAYLSSSSAEAFVLKHYPLGEEERWKEAAERQLSWAWPG